MKTFLSLALLGAAAVHATDLSTTTTSPSISLQDFFVYGCINEYTKAHSFPLFDSSVAYAVEYAEASPEDFTRVYDAAKAFALTLRTPDLSDQEHGGVAVVAQCLDQSRSPAVRALIAPSKDKWQKHE